MVEHVCESCGQKDQFKSDPYKKTVYTALHSRNLNKMKDNDLPFIYEIVNLEEPHGIVYVKRPGSKLEVNKISLEQGISLSEFLESDEVRAIIEYETPEEMLKKINREIAFYGNRLGLMNEIMLVLGNKKLLKNKFAEELAGIIRECNDQLMPLYMQNEYLKKRINKFKKESEQLT